MLLSDIIQESLVNVDGMHNFGFSFLLVWVERNATGKLYIITYTNLLHYFVNVLNHRNSGITKCDLAGSI